MKQLLLAFLFCIAVGQAHAAQIALAWDASAGATGYKVYCGTATGVYAAPVDVAAALTKTVTLNPGSNYCAVTAYNAVAESAKSNELAIPLPPGVPGNLRFTVTLTWNEQLQQYDMKITQAP